MTVRPARPGDAAAIAAVHVSAWRSAYAGLLPDRYLSGLSETRHAAQQLTAILSGHAVFVAEAEGRVVGYCSVGRARRSGIADGEVETLYVADDWRERGFGRALLCAGAGRLLGIGCGSLFLWVLEGNPARWFYERMGGKAVARSITPVGGRGFEQVAYAWAPIGQLLQRAQV